MAATQPQSLGEEGLSTSNVKCNIVNGFTNISYQFDGATKVLGCSRLWLSATVLLAVLLLAAKAVYNIYFHPLARFPGPRRAAASEWWYVKTWFGGDCPEVIRDLHTKYGNIVRIAPNDLSCSTPEAARDIYYHVVNGRPKLLKSDDYERTELASVATVQDPAEHRRQRSSLANAFSMAAIREKQGIVNRSAGKLIEYIREHGCHSEGIDVIPIYTWLTFDITGHLTFTKDLQALNGDKDTQYWTTLHFNGVLWGLLPNSFKRLPIWRLLYRIYVPSNAAAQRGLHKSLTETLVDERLSKGPTSKSQPKDLLDYLLKDKLATREELVSQSMIFLAAGSGTVQSALTGATFYLLKNPEAPRKLQEEIRSSLLAPEEITDETTTCLPYLNAVIQESIRLFPPLPSRLPRVSPGTSIDGHYVPTGVVVSATRYNISRDPKYWSHADDFCPERWLPAQDQQGNAFVNDRRSASKPFSSGPRGCLGVNLARMELRLVLSRLVLAFDWDFVAGSERWDQRLKVYFLWNKPPLRVRFTARARRP